MRRKPLLLSLALLILALASSASAQTRVVEYPLGWGIDANQRTAAARAYQEANWACEMVKMNYLFQGYIVVERSRTLHYLSTTRLRPPNQWLWRVNVKKKLVLDLFRIPLLPPPAGPPTPPTGATPPMPGFDPNPPIRR